MASNGSKMLLAEANAAHQGDKAALLAAINEAAKDLGGKRGVSGGFALQQSSALMKNSKVNSTVAKDLVSNAGSKVGDMGDFKGTD